MQGNSIIHGKLKDRQNGETLYIAEKKQEEPKQEGTKPRESTQTQPQTSEQNPEKMLYDNKWTQLSAIYPHVRPFQDEREYLSIGPQDFVILPDKFYKKANNSFLLHGYYNYRHLILKKVDYHGENRFYIGVPGAFFDREKQVAVMFGFENFECKHEPAQTGDYGYYLMRIEI
jgi:hypothetical protein